MNYDVFISSKSEDYHLARQIYDYLVASGYCVFLADTELRKKGVAEYGEVIDDALDSSEHMILFASRADFVCSSYVKNEWRTFLEEKRSGRKAGNIVTILKGVKVESLPISLRHFQSFGFDNFEHVVDFLPKSSGEIPSIKPENREKPIQPATPIFPVKFLTPEEEKKRWQAEWDNWNKERKATPQKRVKAQKGKYAVGYLTSEEEKKRWQAEWDNWNKERKATPQKRVKAQKGKYAVGDLYDDGVKHGVVVEVTPDGRHGKIMSIETGSQMWAYGNFFGCFGSDSLPCNQLINVNSDDGTENMRLIQQLLSWRQNYPAFAWCAAFGKDWYIPSVKEYRKILSDVETLVLINATLKRCGSTYVFSDDRWYWASNEASNHAAKYVYIDASMRFNVSALNKSNNVRVRAVAKF